MCCHVATEREKSLCFLCWWRGIAFFHIFFNFSSFHKSYYYLMLHNLSYWHQCRGQTKHKQIKQMVPACHWLHNTRSSARNFSGFLILILTGPSPIMLVSSFLTPTMSTQACVIFSLIALIFESVQALYV
jgi:hypothetical protein